MTTCEWNGCCHEGEVEPEDVPGSYAARVFDLAFLEDDARLEEEEDSCEGCPYRDIPGACEDHRYNGGCPLGPPD